MLYVVHTYTDQCIRFVLLILCVVCTRIILFCVPFMQHACVIFVNLKLQCLLFLCILVCVDDVGIARSSTQKKMKSVTVQATCPPGMHEILCISFVAVCDSVNIRYRVYSWS